MGPDYDGVYTISDEDAYDSVSNLDICKDACVYHRLVVFGGFLVSF